MTTPFLGPERPAYTRAQASRIDASGTNLIGITGLVCAVLGTLLSLAAPTATFGAPLLQAAFILGVVGLFPQGARKALPAAALVVAILGTALTSQVLANRVTTSFGDAELQMKDLEELLNDPRFYEDPRSRSGADTGAGTVSDPAAGWPTDYPWGGTPASRL